MFLVTLGSVGVHAQLVNPGFEGSYQPVNSSSKKITGFIANGWTDNSAWADVTVNYSQDTSNPHGGSSCQKVTITSIDSGSFQMVQNLPARTGHLYTPGVWLRGVPGTRVNLWFALAGPPYTIFEDVPAYLTNTWQFVSVPAHPGFRCWRRSSMPTGVQQALGRLGTSPQWIAQQVQVALRIGFHMEHSDR